MVEFLGEVIAGAVLLVVSSLSAYIFNYFRMKKQEILTNSAEIEKNSEDIENMKRLFIMLGKKLDKGSRIYHNDTDADFEELVKDLLTREILGVENRCPV